MGKESKIKETRYIDQQDSYHFKLKGNSSLYFKSKVQVSFEPVKALDFDQGQQKIRSYSIVPKFNLDRRYYSQAFSNEYEGTEADIKLKSQHNSRLKELNSKDVVTKLMPKPRSSKICFVCRRAFIDYLQHIQSDHHQRKIRKSEYDRYINQLIGIMILRKNREKRKIIK